MAEPPRYEIFHDVMGDAVREWRREYVAQREQEEASRKLVAEREEARAEAHITRRRLQQTRLLAAGLTVVLLIAGVLGVYSYLTSRETAQQKLLHEAAAAFSENPVMSLRKALEAYGISPDEEAREAVLTAASVPRSRVVAEPPGESSREPRVVGMVGTLDQQHGVAYDDQGGIRVISGDGKLKEAKAVGLAGTVDKPAPSPSGAHVALATDRGSAGVIDVRTGTQVNLMTDGSPASAVSWIESPPDDLILVVTSSGRADTYSAKTGQPVAHFPDPVYQALPTADGQVVTSEQASQQDSRLRVWNARTAEKMAESSPLSSQVRHLQRYRNEVVGVVGSTTDREIYIIRWDWKARLEPRKSPPFSSNNIAQVVVDKAARAVALALDKLALTYSLDDDGSLKLKRILPVQPDWVRGVAVDPHGLWIATAGADGRVLVWSAKDTGSEIEIPNRATYEFIAHRSGIRSVSYLHDGKALISLGFDGAVRLWDVPQVQRFDLHNNWVRDLDISISADERWLATASYDGDVRILDPADVSKGPVARVPVGAHVTSVRFDPTDPHRIITLASRSKQPQRWVWDSGRGAERLLEFNAPSRLGPLDSLVSLDISRDGTMVAAGDSRGNVYLWNAHTGKLLGDPALGNAVLTGSGQGAFGIAFDPSGRMLAATSSDGVRLKKLDTEEKPTLLPLPDATRVAFDPHGKRIISGARGGTLRVWTSDGQLLHKHKLVAHGSTLSRLSFSGDGDLVAMGTNEGLIEVWNVDSGRRVMLTRQHGDSVNDVLFLPGSRSRLVSASDDSTVAVSRCDACEDPDAVVRDAERWVKDSN